MTEDELVSLLKQEEADASSFYSSELAKHQTEALKRYFGEPYGDEVPGRSSVVSHDLEDTVNWIMPDLMRCFTASEDLVSMQATRPEDDQEFDGADGRSKADMVAAYLSHIFFQDNTGAETVHDFLQDGLLARAGVIQASWEDPEPGPPRMIEGVHEAQLIRYMQDKEYEILSAEQDETDAFSIEVRRTPKMGRVHIAAVPPEEFAVHKAAKRISEAKYHRRKRLAYLAELIRKYPEKADELRDRKPLATDITSDGRYAARHPGDSNEPLDAQATDNRREVYLIEEYVRIDFDGDGIVELRYVKRVDDIVLENIAVERSDYFCWTPSRVAHKAIGRSLYDMLKDITKIRTVITRAYLDGLQGTVNPRTYANKQAIDQDGFDALLDNETGGVIQVKGDPRAAVMESVSPDVSGPALEGLTYFDERGAEATGVTKQAQGMDPQAMNKTATGIDLLQAAAKTRIELIARWAGIALEDVFKHILHLVCAHQDQPRQLKLFGKWFELDPRTWSDEMAVKIDIGSAGVSRQQRISNLIMISQGQKEIFTTMGAGNPLVSLQHLRNSYTSIVSEMGFPDPSYFFGEIPQDWQPPPQQDPKALEVQGKMQLEQAKAQVTSQMDAQKLQHDQAVSEAKFSHEREMAMIKAQTERETAQMKMQSEHEIAKMRIEAETLIAAERTKAEMALAQWKSTQELKIKAKEAKANGAAKRSKVNGKASGSGVRMGGQIG